MTARRFPPVLCGTCGRRIGANAPHFQPGDGRTLCARCNWRDPKHCAVWTTRGAVAEQRGTVPVRHCGALTRTGDRCRNPAIGNRCRHHEQVPLDIEEMF